jgi:hypothetical protein
VLGRTTSSRSSAAEECDDASATARRGYSSTYANARATSRGGATPRLRGRRLPLPLQPRARRTRKPSGRGSTPPSASSSTSGSNLRLRRLRRRPTPSASSETGRPDCFFGSNKLPLTRVSRAGLWVAGTYSGGARSHVGQSPYEIARHGRTSREESTEESTGADSSTRFGLNPR